MQAIVANPELIERWEQVIRVLSGLTPHQKKKRWSMAKFVTKTACGTVACAAGHAAMDPWFKRRGLKILNRSLTGLLHPGYTATRNELVTFFDEKGVDDIFYDPRRRAVSTVIREIRAHIDSIKASVP